ncbi:MAG: PepSY domain-containing protein [Erysipelothrix sp.]|nr:PepSY domain-containing protein [Erysipelothrix sp.]
MKKILVLILFVMLVLVGCDKKDEPVTKEKRLNVNVEEAFDIFMETFPDSVVHKIEYKNLVYEIKGHKDDLEHELKLDADSKEIIKKESEVEDNFYGELNRDDLDNIFDLIAVSEKELTPEFELYKWELEAEHVFTSFEVEFKDGKKEAEFKYDFDSGELLKKELD